MQRRLFGNSGGKALVLGCPCSGGIGNLWKFKSLLSMEIAINRHFIQHTKKMMTHMRRQQIMKNPLI